MNYILRFSFSSSFSLPFSKITHAIVQEQEQIANPRIQEHQEQCSIRFWFFGFQVLFTFLLSFLVPIHFLYDPQLISLLNRHGNNDFKLIVMLLLSLIWSKLGKSIWGSPSCERDVVSNCYTRYYLEPHKSFQKSYTLFRPLIFKWPKCLKNIIIY